MTHTVDETGAQQAREGGHPVASRTNESAEATAKDGAWGHSETSAELPVVDMERPVLQPAWVEDEADHITDITSLPELLNRETYPERNRPVIVRLEGAHAGELFAVDRDVVSIGRHPSNQVRINDPGISRFHARVSKRNNAITLADLGSRNGTFVSGSRQKSVRLADGDLIQLGPRVTLRFSWVDAHEEALMRRLYESSTVDGLTGVYNRKHFNERLVSEIAFSERHRSSLALILMDIDHFKRINDSFGHTVGDEVLRRVARCCQEQLRAEDVFARYGGEEFAVVLRGVGLQGAARLAERLRVAVSLLSINYDGIDIAITTSAGCATLECCRASSVAALVDAADARLYRAKQLGRNAVVANDESS